MVNFSIIPTIENDKLALRYINDRISNFIEVHCSMKFARRTAFVSPFQKPFYILSSNSVLLRKECIIPEKNISRFNKNEVFKNIDSPI